MKGILEDTDPPFREMCENAHCSADSNESLHFASWATDSLLAAVRGGVRRAMRHLEAYAAGGDAHERGEPAQAPATVPRHRKYARLKGWADQRCSWSGSQAETQGRREMSYRALAALVVARRC